MVISFNEALIWYWIIIHVTGPSY